MTKSETKSKKSVLAPVLAAAAGLTIGIVAYRWMAKNHGHNKVWSLDDAQEYLKKHKVQFDDLPDNIKSAVDEAQRNLVKAAENLLEAAHSAKDAVAEHIPAKITH